MSTHEHRRKAMLLEVLDGGEKLGLDDGSKNLYTTIDISPRDYQWFRLECFPYCMHISNS